MEQYQNLKQRLISIDTSLIHLLESILSNPDLAEKQFEDWRNACLRIQSQLDEDVVRIAVVGPIKSGKSTFVNSLLKGDFLKRGAGVVTSFVTRVRKGDTLKATLRFKSWNEINQEISRTAGLLPNLADQPEPREYDIRNRKDRQALLEALHSLTAEQLIAQNTKSPAGVLLSSYLKGFDTIKAMNFQEDMSIQYVGDRLHEHRDFSGDEILAVYLKDIQLEINAPITFKDLEIADCQGSDSPNPLHLAMIQDYLLTAHLLIYVISSRTGLREADIRFLSMIKKMGIMENILFVVNCDFSEHETLGGLQTLIGKISDEISLIKLEPRIFSFSALYNLFHDSFTKISEKDQARLNQWCKETTFTHFSDTETERFMKVFDQKVTDERFALLLRNHFERLRLVTSGTANWIAMRREVMTGDKDRATAIIDKLKRHQVKIDQLTQMIKKTIDGGTHHIKNKLRKDIDVFLDSRYGEVAGDLNHFIRAFSITFDTYADHLTNTGFNPTLFLIFQDFKQAVDQYMAQTVTPRIIHYLAEMENEIHLSLDAVAKPFDTMIRDALNAYECDLKELGISLQRSASDQPQVPDMDSIKKIADLNIPQASAMLQYSATVKTDAILRLGFYSLRHFFRKLFKKHPSDKQAEQFNALADSVKRMKKETETTIAFHIKSYKENIKFQYLFKLTDAAANGLYQNLADQFKAYVTDLSTLGRLLDEKRIDKERISLLLKEMEKMVTDIDAQIHNLEKKLYS